MARPRHEQPTPAELEVLKILWDRGGPASVRDVLDVANRHAAPPRAYTSVMSLLNVMTDKGLLRRTPQGRAFLYEPVSPREQTLRSLLGETLERVYDGSSRLLVAHLLDQSHPSAEELDQIRSLLDEYQKRRSRDAGGRRFPMPTLASEAFDGSDRPAGLARPAPQRLDRPAGRLGGGAVAPGGDATLTPDSPRGTDRRDADRRPGADRHRDRTACHRIASGSASGADSSGHPGVPDRGIGDPVMGTVRSVPWPRGPGLLANGPSIRIRFGLRRPRGHRDPGGPTRRDRGVVVRPSPRWARSSWWADWDCTALPDRPKRPRLPFSDRSRRLARLLRLRRIPIILVHAGRAEPFLCGVLRPAVVLPRSWISGASPRCLDAILAHELAHARRLDHLVNLGQRLVEVGLCFHPAVHWLSRSLRRERELCADALAVRLTGDPLALAEALQSVARLRLTSPRMAAVGASPGGPSVSLLPRIQELLGMTPSRPRRSVWPFAALPAAGFLALVAAASGIAEARPSPSDTPPQTVAGKMLTIHRAFCISGSVPRAWSPPRQVTASYNPPAIRPAIRTSPTMIGRLIIRSASSTATSHPCVGCSTGSSSQARGRCRRMDPR